MDAIHCNIIYYSLHFIIWHGRRNGTLQRSHPIVIEAKNFIL